MTRVRPALLLTGALVLLSSLYLPWQETAVGAWSSQAGDATALSALLLAVAAVRPGRARDRLLDLGALFAGYFALALFAVTRSVAHGQLYGVHLHLHYASGAYVGAAGMLVVLAGGATRRWELRRPTVTRLATLALAAGLLVALLLPWERLTGKSRIAYPGIELPVAVVAAVLALCLVAGRGNRLVVAAAAALSTGAAFSTVTVAFGFHRSYGAWMGLGFALALAVLALPEIRTARPARPSALALAAGGAAALLVVSMFLPWQRACVTAGGGVCASADGWTSVPGAAAAVVALALVAVLIVPPRRDGPAIELAVGVALLVATLGSELVAGDFSGTRESFGYGSTLGFAAAALLVALVLARVRPPRFVREDLVRLLPVAACAAYAVVVALPWWGVLSYEDRADLRFAPLSWPTVIGVLVAIRLLGLWVRRVSDVRLVFLPLGLLALAALELIRYREIGIAWGGGIVAGLSLLLVLLGLAEQRGGLRNLRVPEILRVDRL
jgi:hypothetical protein